jgi:DNA methylase
MKIPVFLPVTREFGFQRRVRSWRRSRTRPASPSPHPERGDRCHVAAGAIAANRDVHPTVKPAAMVADAILDCSARGDIVLDGFLGSGTTVIAAERTGRRCYGLELDPAYVDTIIRRWQTLTGGSARHAVSGRSFDDLTREAEATNAV